MLFSIPLLPELQENDYFIDFKNSITFLRCLSLITFMPAMGYAILLPGTSDLGSCK